MATTVVFSGGPSPGSEAAAVLAAALGPGSRTPDRVIAADGGLQACLAAGLEPDVVVGDMDSEASADLTRAEVAGVRIERHPRYKDAVDLELALDAALRAAGSGTPIPPTTPGGRTGPTPARARLVVIGSAGGRLDHLVASMLLLGSPRYRGFEVEGYLGSQRIVPVHDTRALEEWQRRWQEAVDQLLRARALGAGPELDRVARVAPPVPAAVVPDWQASMGITFPGSVRCDPGAPPALTSTAALRPAAAAYHRALVAAADQAATSAAVRRLEVELGATRRRRRAVEERLQPRLETSLRTLDVQLDELDREAALRVRTVLERREEGRP